MARASRIYAVTDVSRVLATFTVKHECRAYCDKHWPHRDHTRIMVNVFDDGPEGWIDGYTLKEFAA